MLAKIKDILIIVNKGQLNQYRKLIPSGENLGLKITFIEQDKPRGLPDAFILGEKFINKKNVAMILGDNFFYGQNLSKLLSECANLKKGANVYLEGQLSTRKWRDEKSGQDKYSTEIVLQGYNSSLTMLGGKTNSNNSNEISQDKSSLPNDQMSQDSTDLDDEIPF